MKTMRVVVLCLSPLLLNAICARSVGPATPPVVAVPVDCFGPDGRTEVVVSQDPRRPTSSPILRVNWTFRVRCAQTPHRYSFGVAQDASNSLTLTPAPPVEAPPIAFSPSATPFAFHIDGRVHGSWCASATVELTDGNVLHVGEFFIDQSRRPNDIALLAFHHSGADRAAPLSGFMQPCRL